MIDMPIKKKIKWIKAFIVILIAVVHPACAGPKDVVKITIVGDTNYSDLEKSQKEQLAQIRKKPKG
jgi:hypothetical protein